MTTDEEIIIFGENVKKLRKQNQMNQRDFASKCDIGVGSLRLIERGVWPKRMSVKFIFSLYYEFGVKPSKMFVPWQD